VCVCACAAAWREPPCMVIIIIKFLFITLNLEWCDKIKPTNLLLPRKSGTIKSLQLLSTSGTLLALEQLGTRALRPTWYQGHGRVALPGCEGVSSPQQITSPAAEDSYLRLIDSCITQLKAQGPSRTCNGSKEKEKKSPLPHVRCLIHLYIYLRRCLLPK